MRRKGWGGCWPTNMGGTIGGRFEEREAMQEELLEALQAGPGEAARQEVAVGASGPGPCRWTLRTIRVSVEGLAGDTLSGGGRGGGAPGPGGDAPVGRVVFPCSP